MKKDFIKVKRLIYICNTQNSGKDGKCSTVSGPDAGARCIFPFKFRGISYNDCRTQHDGRKWCATEVDHNGWALLRKGKWGYCPDEGCSGHGGIGDSRFGDGCRCGS